MKKELEQITIQNFDELMQYTRINGIPTDDLEAMNHISDIIGNQTYNTLADYMNNINAQELLFILKYIWPIADIFKFYNDYSNNSQVYQLKQELKDQSERLNKLYDENRELNRKWTM